MNKILLHNTPLLGNPIYFVVVKDPHEAAKYPANPRAMHLPVPGGLSEQRSGVLCSLLIHEKMCIGIEQIINLLAIFGVDDCIKLLESKAIEVYEDLGPGVLIVVEKEPHTYQILNALMHLGDKFSLIEHDLSLRIKSTKYDLNQKQINTILYLLNSFLVLEEKDLQGELLFEETSHDLRNKNITDRFKIASNDIEEVHKSDFPHIMRIHNINSGLIDAKKRVQANSILLDPWAKSFIEGKLSPANRDYSLYASAEVFKETIVSKKGIPDLNLLYERGLISIDDIIELRETKDGKFFRKWISEEVQYDPELILKALINRKPPRLKNKILQCARFVFPVGIGFLEPTAGVAASGLSYIGQKIFEGWHPSLFLDYKFKLKINKNIQSKHRGGIRKRRKDYKKRMKNS